MAAVAAAAARARGARGGAAAPAPAVARGRRARGRPACHTREETECGEDRAADAGDLDAADGSVCSRLDSLNERIDKSLENVTAAVQATNRVVREMRDRPKLPTERSLAAQRHAREMHLREEGIRRQERFEELRKRAQHQQVQAQILKQHLHAQRERVQSMRSQFAIKLRAKTTLPEPTASNGEKMPPNGADAARAAGGEQLPSGANGAAQAANGAAKAANGAAKAANGAAKPANGAAQATNGARPQRGGPDASPRGSDNGVSVVEEHCGECHPGALCCTEQIAHFDEASGVATVRFTTTVRSTAHAGDRYVVGLEAQNRHRALSPEDAMTLAMQTLAEEADKGTMERAANAPPTRTARERHRDIVRVLGSGKIIGAVPTDPPSEFGHISYKVRIKDRLSSRVVTALFKPRVPGDDAGWHRSPIEWVAYELNLLLGLDVVPPVALRCDVHVDDKHWYEGAFIYLVEHNNHVDGASDSSSESDSDGGHHHHGGGGVSVLRDVPQEDWGIGVDHLLSDTRILDVLLQNSDRHHGHLLFGPHWCKTKEDGSAAMVPFLIDHAAGFRPEAYVALDQENAFQTGAVERISASTYLRLRFLHPGVLKKTFGGVLTGRELQLLQARRDGLLAYFDRRVEEHGLDAVVFDDR